MSISGAEFDATNGIGSMLQSLNTSVLLEDAHDEANYVSNRSSTTVLATFLIENKHQLSVIFWSLQVQAYIHQYREGMVACYCVQSEPTFSKSIIAQRFVLSALGRS